MSNPAAFGTIEFESESGFAEAVTTFTGGGRMPHIGMIDTTGLVDAKEVAGHVEQYRGAGHQTVLMGQDGEIKTTFDLCGHGSTTAGTPTVTVLETILGIVFGTSDFSLATSQTLTGGTAAVPTTSGASGVAAGGIVAIGALGDGDGDGQMYAAATHAANALTLLNALRGAPVNGAVLYPCRQFYMPSSPTTTDVASIRMQVLTPNMQYRLHGVFPKAAGFRALGPNGRPQIDVTWGVARWGETASGTFPSPESITRNLPGPVAGGSLFINTVGTATRNEMVCKDFTLEVDLGIEVQRGSGGVGNRQTIVGAKRTESIARATFVVDADSTTATPVIPTWARAEDPLHFLYTLNTDIGKRVGIRSNKFVLDSVPVQMGDGRINRFRASGMLCAGDTLTSELTRAAFLMGWA